MRLVPLGSGSRGNATLVEFGSTRLLVDAGLSARTLAARLEARGVTPRQVDWVLLTHEHDDHARGAERFSKRHGVPLICLPETLEALDLSPVHLAGWEPLVPQGRMDLGAVQIEAFPVPHDAVRPVGYVIHGEGLRVGIATDVGHATSVIRQRLRGCHLLLVEANHDDRMLWSGAYPWRLKQRVSGGLGHLSNREAADLLRDVVSEECRAVVLGHLSEKNNTPALVRQVGSGALPAVGHGRLELRVAATRGPTPPVHL